MLTTRFSKYIILPLLLLLGSSILYGQDCSDFVIAPSDHGVDPVGGADLANGNFFVVWAHYGLEHPLQDNSTVQGRVIPVEGSPSRIRAYGFPLRQEAIGDQAYAVGFDSRRSRFLLLFESLIYRPGVKSRIVTSDGKLLSATHAVTDIFESPRLAYNSLNDEFLLGYVRVNFPTDNRLEFLRLTHDGSPTGTPTTISDQSVHQILAVLAEPDSTDYTVFFSSERCCDSIGRSKAIVRLQRITAGGALSGSAKTIIEAVGLAVTSNPIRKEYLLLVTQSANLKAIRVSAEGKRLASALLVARDVVNADIVFDPSINRYVVAYQRKDESAYFARKLTPFGKTSGKELPFSCGEPGGQIHLLGTSGKYLAFWARGREVLGRIFSHP